MLKKLTLSAVLGFASLAYANINAVVSVLPQKTFVEAIGKDKVNTSLMVKPGNSPHRYEPKPSQMKDIANADIYFSINIDFEKTWLPKFANQNRSMKIVDLSQNIEKIPMQKHFHKNEHHEEHKNDADHKHEDHHEHGKYDQKMDPHVWTSPKNVKIIAKNILTELIKLDPKNKNYYEENYKKFIAKINKTDNQIKTIFKDLPKNSKFMIFHPAWGYFAKQYNLIQMPVEIEGKSPKPKTVLEIIEHAKEQNVKAIFANPETSDKTAKQIAKELNIQVIKISPLNPKWCKNVIRFAKAIANK